MPVLPITVAQPPVVSDISAPTPVCPVTHFFPLAVPACMATPRLDGSGARGVASIYRPEFVARLQRSPLCASSLSAVMPVVENWSALTLQSFLRACEGNVSDQQGLDLKDLKKRSDQLSQDIVQSVGLLLKEYKNKGGVVPLVVGLGGGIGSGKTTVSKILGSLGATIINFDELGHLVRDRDATKALVHRFGSDILGADGKIDRKKLGSLVFDAAHPENMALLQSIMMPLMLQEFYAQLSQCLQTQHPSLVVAEAAMFHQTGLASVISQVWQVRVKEETALARIMNDPSRHLPNRDYALAAMEAQKADLQALASVSGLVVDNDGSPEELLQKVKEEFDYLQAVSQVLAIPIVDERVVLRLPEKFAKQLGFYAIGFVPGVSPADKKKAIESILLNKCQVDIPVGVTDLELTGAFFNRHRETLERFEDAGTVIHWPENALAFVEPSQESVVTDVVTQRGPIVLTGTFEIISNETMDFIERAYRVFGGSRHLILGVADNPQTGHVLLPLEKRVDVAALAMKQRFAQIEIVGFKGLTTDFACRMGASLVLRRLRSFSDLTSEYAMARGLWEASSQRVDTAFLVPDLALSHISPRMLRDQVLAGQSVRSWCPDFVAAILAAQAAGVDLDFRQICRIYKRCETDADFKSDMIAGPGQVTAVYAGSFSPPTFGHFDIVDRALGMVDHLHVLAAVNPAKKNLFTSDEIVAMLTDNISNHDRTTVAADAGLVVDYARTVGARLLVRGIRDIKDWGDELGLASANRRVASDIETLFVFPYRYLDTSSSLARLFAQYPRLHEQLNRVVPQPIKAVLLEKMGQK